MPKQARLALAAFAFCTFAALMLCMAIGHQMSISAAPGALEAAAAISRHMPIFAAHGATDCRLFPAALTSTFPGKPFIDSDCQPLQGGAELQSGDVGVKPNLSLEPTLSPGFPEHSNNQHDSCTFVPTL